MTCSKTQCNPIQSNTRKSKMKLVPTCEILCYSFNKLNKALKETEVICDVENGESAWGLRGRGPDDTGQSRMHSRSLCQSNKIRNLGVNCTVFLKASKKIVKSRMKTVFVPWGITRPFLDPSTDQLWLHSTKLWDSVEVTVRRLLVNALLMLSPFLLWFPLFWKWGLA